jgi:phosphatidylglycerol:prolipoprotein diacylglycerol transferase
MLPTLFELGSFKIHSFGVMVAIGFVMGIWWCGREAVRLGYERDRILDLCFWLLISGVLGARILFVIVNWHEFWRFFAAQREAQGVVGGTASWIVEMLAIWKGGIVWYGGLLGAFGVGVLYMRRHKLPVFATSDLIAPGVMLGLAFGRLGCFAAGDDHGRVVESAWKAVQAGGKAPWWTLTFANPQSLIPDDMLGKPLYPTQLMMSGKDLIIFAVLLWMRRIKTFHGQLVWTMMIMYAVLRAYVEYYRGDVGRGFLIPGIISTSQFISILTFVFGVAMLLYCSRTQRAPIQIRSDRGTESR